MIKIERLACPDTLRLGLMPESKGEVETKDAIAFYSDVANHQNNYMRTGVNGNLTKKGYTAYNDKEVRKTLHKMFNGKCAYCESKISAIYSGDIEHFRPKGRIQGITPSKPAYFWLAAEWDNLLFSCPFCNQTNTHEITAGGKTKEVVLGKLDQFPLISERCRLNHLHGLNYFLNNPAYQICFDLEESERLLLNPCKDINVETYFKYDDDGAIIINDGLIVIDQNKAETSITVYALHRLSLSNARKEKIIQIKAQIKRVENAIRNFNDHFDDAIEEKKIWFEGIMREEMTILKRFKDSDQEYAGLARYIINKYFDEAKFL